MNYKALVICNFFCAICFIISLIMSFINKQNVIGIIDSIIAITFIAVGIYNLKKLRSNI